MDLSEDYIGKKVLITGGLGFIGSSLARKLVKLGSKITIMDSKLKGHGFNCFNIKDIKNKIFLDESDIRDKEKVIRNVKEKDVIFDFAAYINPHQNEKKEKLEKDINIKGHLNILEACRISNPDCRIIFPGSRMEYGAVNKKDIPIKEDHPLLPLTDYASDKIVVENYLQFYREKYNLESITLRLTNPFGPRAQIKSPQYCIANWFIRQALENKEIKIFGEGTQIRDYIFIDDMVEAFAIAGVHPNPKNKIYNVGSGEMTKFKDMAEMIVHLVGKGKILQVSWPKNYKNTETGDFCADISRIHQDLGWKPRTNFEEGLKKTINFYKKNLNKYID